MLKQLLTAALLLGAGALWAQQTAGLLPVREAVHCNEWVANALPHETEG